MPRIKQNILPNTQERYIHAHHFTVNRIDELIAMIPSATNVLGFALQLSSEGRVDAIAFSTLDEAFYVVLQRSFQSETALGSTAYQANRKGDAAPRSPPSPNLVFEVTEHLGAVLAGFSMARLALHIYRDKGWPMRGIDLSSLSRSQEERPLSPAEFLEKKVSASVKRRGADVLWYPDDSEDDEEIANRVCLRAWLSAVCANADLLALRGASYVDTRLESLNSQQLHCLGEMILCAELLEAQRPSRFENDFDSIKDDGDGLTVTNARFKNRIRASAQTIVVLGRADGTEIRSQVKGASGKRTMLRVIEGQSRGGFTRATVHGREELTTAENARDSFALRVMQGFILPQDRRFINLIWFPSQTRMPARNGGPSESWEFEKLNDSQRQVASAMLSTSEPLVIVHGPPGTGKTSTIAAAADCWIQQAQPVWIIAQSNVGVKNIARSFISKNITGFKLLVSKEFHFEWHEHLYEDIQSQFIRTDDLSQLKDVYETERFLGTTSIILCTLSTLSNPVLTKCGMFKLRPANVVVVDEASQINVFEYMHLFHRFKDLEKVCFFGDPKQLPPFGQDAVPQLQSIFDVKHLKPQAYFLNTQYRMPVPLGNFISHAVYNSELKSNHAIQDTSCIAFIDAAKGQEVQSGKSWTKHVS
ncbi:P-loop containing nucleoside triphosphate hydrolase protein [Trametopsis cervina]|nr:P-loop containing nucleoside triphosphate hydrolase protein [Trametopsis cervina]